MKLSPGEGYDIECMVETEKGFITGGSNGTMFIYEKDDTHLNELGLTTLSNFLLTNVVK